MSDSVALDLFIQDFVNTNKLLGQHLSWLDLTSRRWADDAAPRIYEFTSGGETHYARGQRLCLPDAEWLRIEMCRPIPAIEEHRVDYLRIISAKTHSRLTVEQVNGAVVIRLWTGNRGLINLVFVVRDSTGITVPVLA
jgi:hypothetical protein